MRPSDTPLIHLPAHLSPQFHLVKSNLVDPLQRTVQKDINARHQLDRSSFNRHRSGFDFHVNKSSFNPFPPGSHKEIV